MTKKTHETMNNIVGAIILIAASIFLGFYVIIPTYLRIKQIKPESKVIADTVKVVYSNQSEYPVLPAPNEKKEFADALYGKYNNDAGESNSIFCIATPKIGDSVTTSFDTYLYSSKVVPDGYSVKVVKAWVKQSNKAIFEPNIEPISFVVSKETVYANNEDSKYHTLDNLND